MNTIDLDALKPEWDIVFVARGVSIATVGPEALESGDSARCAPGLRSLPKRIASGIARVWLGHTPTSALRADARSIVRAEFHDVIDQLTFGELLTLTTAWRQAVGDWQQRVALLVAEQLASRRREAPLNADSRAAARGMTPLVPGRKAPSWMGKAG